MADHPLDSLVFVTRLDPKGMYRLTCDFPDQCQRALAIADETPLRPLPRQPRNIVLSGLGGSAIGGDFLRFIMDAQGGIPMVVNRDYSIPNWVDENTLFIASSYSGNTEETLAAYDLALKKGAMIVANTSGGQLKKKCEQDGFDVVTIPAGQPPRTALGYSLMPALKIAEKFGLIPAQPYQSTIERLKQVVGDCSVENSIESNLAKQVAEKLAGKLSVIYGLGDWQGVVAYRWKGQINENSKNMTFSASFPELNHNEILGWVKVNLQQIPAWVLLVLQDGTESPKMQARSRITQDLIGDRCEKISITVSGNSLLEKSLSMTLLGDFVSLYLAALNEVDPENIDWLNILKGQLSNVPAS